MKAKPPAKPMPKGMPAPSARPMMPKGQHRMPSGVMMDNADMVPMAKQMHGKGGKKAK